MKHWTGLLLWLIVACSAVGTFAQDRAVIERAKSATALVDRNNGESTATAFCIKSSGFFVTNAHVVEGLDIGDSVDLVLDAGMATQRKIEAEVVREEHDSDLALLKAKNAGEFTELALAVDGSAFETMPLTAFGFPFGKGLALDKGNYPTVSVNVGRVTALRLEKSVLRLIQVDVQLNPGNSGGPVLNDKGEVVGIVSFGVAGSGVNFLIPVEKLRALLARPTVKVQAPEFTVENVKSPHRVEVTPTAFQEAVAEPSVEFWLRKGTGKAVSFLLASEDQGKFAGMVSLPAREAASRLKCKMEFSTGIMEGLLSSQEFSIDGKTFQLADAESISADGEKVVVRFRDGVEKNGELKGLDSVPLDLGGYSVAVDLKKASSIDLEPTSEPQSIDYIVIVKSKGKEIHRISSREAAEDADAKPSRPAPVVASLKPYTGAKKKIPVPGLISDVVQAGGLRYLVLVMKTQKKLAIFDMTSQAIEKILPLPTDDVVVAGTLNYLVIVDRTRGVIEKWSLNGFKREMAVKSPLTGDIRTISAGYLTDGPLLAVHNRGAPTGSESYGVGAIDLKNLTEIPLKTQGQLSIHSGAMHVRAAGIGSVFTMWNTGVSPSGLHTMFVTDKEIVVKYEHQSDGALALSVDGMHVFTTNGRVYTTGLKRLHANSVRTTPCFPTSHPRFYLTVPIFNVSDAAAQSAPPPGFHEVGTEAPLLNLPSLDLGTTSYNAEEWMSDFTWDKRVYYQMPLHLLVSIPFENNGIVVQPFDLLQELKAAEIDYFFVSSVPPRIFEPGKPYEYQIAIESKKPKVRYELSNGPKGMKISANGRITWRPPDNYSKVKEDVIVSITNEADQQTYESFTIYKVD